MKNILTLVIYDITVNQCDALQFFKYFKVYSEFKDPMWLSPEGNKTRNETGTQKSQNALQLK